MANALKDNNDRSTIIAVDSTTPTIIRRVTASPTTHSISVDDNTTGSNNGNNGGVALLDENSVPVWTALSSAGDGTLVEVYADSAGRLLINSN